MILGFLLLSAPVSMSLRKELLEAVCGLHCSHVENMGVLIVSKCTKSEAALNLTLGNSASNEYAIRHSRLNIIRSRYQSSI